MKQSHVWEKLNLSFEAGYGQAPCAQNGEDCGLRSPESSSLQSWVLNFAPTRPRAMLQRGVTSPRSANQQQITTPKLTHRPTSVHPSVRCCGDFETVQNVEVSGFRTMVLNQHQP